MFWFVSIKVWIYNNSKFSLDHNFINVYIYVSIYAVYLGCTLYFLNFVLLKLIYKIFCNTNIIKLYSIARSFGHAYFVSFQSMLPQFGNLVSYSHPGPWKTYLCCDWHYNNLNCWIVEDLPCTSKRANTSRDL